MSFNKSDVLHAAIQLEQDGYKFYLESAKLASNKFAKEMYQMLAEEENCHISWLEKFDNGILSQPSSPKSIYNRLKKIFADTPNVKNFKMKLAEDDVVVLKKAIEKEEESIDAYNNWADNCEDKQVRDFCKLLANIEKEHRQILSKELEYLENTGDWFSQIEHWSFDG